MATVEETILDSEARGLITHDYAKHALSVYQHEIDRHGNHAEAQRVVADLFRRTAEEHRQKAAETRATFLDAINRAHEKQRRQLTWPVRCLQAFVGGVFSAVAVVAAVYLFFFFLLCFLRHFLGPSPDECGVQVRLVLRCL